MTFVHGGDGLCVAPPQQTLDDYPDLCQPRRDARKLLNACGFRLTQGYIIDSPLGLRLHLP